MRISFIMIPLRECWFWDACARIPHANGSSWQSPHFNMSLDVTRTRRDMAFLRVHMIRGISWVCLVPSHWNKMLAVRRDGGSGSVGIEHNRWPRPLPKSFDFSFPVAQFFTRFARVCNIISSIQNRQLMRNTWSYNTNIFHGLLT